MESNSFSVFFLWNIRMVLAWAIQPMCSAWLHLWNPTPAFSLKKTYWNINVWPWYYCDNLKSSFSSVAQLYLSLCDPMDCSMSGLPVHQQLPEFTQTQVFLHLFLKVSHLQTFIFLLWLVLGCFWHNTVFCWDLLM